VTMMYYVMFSDVLCYFLDILYDVLYKIHVMFYDVFFVIFTWYTCDVLSCIL
jgi:hypothetical protein